MNKNDIIKFLRDEDFHIDAQGPMVIDNEEILSTINGATLGAENMQAPLWNGGCANSGCR